MADVDVGAKIKVEDEGTNKIKKFDASLKDSIKSLLKSKLAMAALAAAVGLAIKDYAKFEQKLIDISNLSKSTAEEVEKFGQGILGIATRVPQKAQDLANALFDVVSAGVAVGDSLEFLEAASKLAVAGVTDTKTAVDGLTSVINAYGLEAKDVTKVSDIFFAAQVKGKTTIAELAGSIGVLAPLAKTAGFSIEEMFAAVSTLTKAGIKTDRAVTSLRAAVTSIIKPTDEAKKVAKALGIDFSVAGIKANGFQGVLKQVQEKTKGNSEIIAKLFPQVRGLTGVLSLAGIQAGEFAEQQVFLAKSSGATKKAFDLQSKGMASQLTLLGNNFSVFSKSIVKIFAPGITGLLNLSNGWFKNFNVGLNGAIGFFEIGFAKVQYFFGNQLDKMKDKMSDWVFGIKKAWVSIKGLWKDNTEELAKLEEGRLAKQNEAEKETLERKRGRSLALQELINKQQQNIKEMVNSSNNEMAASDEALANLQKHLATEVTDHTVEEQQNLTDQLDALLTKQTEDEKRKHDFIYNLIKGRELTEKAQVDFIKNAWETAYDDQLSLTENFANTTKGILKNMLVKYLRGLQEETIANTAIGVLRAVSSKNYPQAALVTAQGAATKTLLGAAISGVQGLERGGVVTGNGIYELAEKNKSEAIIPLENPTALNKIKEALGGGGVGTKEVLHNVTLMTEDGMKLAEWTKNNIAQGEVQGRF